MLVLISTSVQLTPLVELITIPRGTNPTPAVVSIVFNRIISSIWTILIEIISIIPKVIYTMPTIISFINNTSSIPFKLITSRTHVGVFILRLLMWIYHLIFFICVIAIIFNTRNCWIDFNAVGFDTVYSSIWFWSVKIIFFLLVYCCWCLVGFFVVADRCKEIPLWWWSNPISISDRVFFCFVIARTPQVLPFPTLIFCFICILTLPVFLSTSSFIQLLSCSCWIICNIYCQLYIFMFCWCWASLTIFYCWPFPCFYSSNLNGC